MSDVLRQTWEINQRNIRSEKYRMENRKDPLDHVDDLLAYPMFTTSDEKEALRELQEFALKNPRKKFKPDQWKILNTIIKKI